MRGRGARRPARPEPIYRAVVLLLDVVVRLLFRVRVVGGEHVPARGAVLVAPNHLSYLDSVVLVVALYRLGRYARFFAVQEAFDRPGLGWLLRTGRQIPARRGGGSEEATRPVRAALDAGELVVVYPEGTIPQPGQQPPARPGVGLLTTACDARVVPATQWGMQRAGRRSPLRLRRPAAVAFHPPVDLKPWRGRSDARAHDEISAHVLAIVRAHLPAVRALVRAQGRRAGPPAAPWAAARMRIRYGDRDGH